MSVETSTSTLIEIQTAFKYSQDESRVGSTQCPTEIMNSDSETADLEMADLVPEFAVDSHQNESRVQTTQCPPESTSFDSETDDFVHELGAVTEKTGMMNLQNRNDEPAEPGSPAGVDHDKYWNFRYSSLGAWVIS